jgi:ATP/maltotriose-dependent transcriptional regulator MalT
MAQAWVAYFKQQPDRIVGILDRVEHLAQTEVQDGPRRRQLLGQAYLLRAWAIRGQGDLAASVALLRRSLELLPADDDNYRGLVHLFLGNALEAQGRLDASFQTLERAAEICLKADNLAAYLGVQASLANAERRLGRLPAARARLEGVLRWAAREKVHYLSSLADIYGALARIVYEQNDLDTAARYMATARSHM